MDLGLTRARLFFGAVNQHKGELHKLAQGLLKHETLSRAEINELLSAGGEAKLTKAKEKAKEAKEAKDAKAKGG